MDTITETRNAMIADAIKQIIVGPVTLETVAALLPDDFGLDQAELDAVVEAHGGPPLTEAHGEPPLQAAEPEPTMTAEESRARIVECGNALAQARGAAMSATQRERDSRGKLAKAIMQFQTGMPQTSPDALRREFCREQAAIREAQANGTLPVKDPWGGVGKSRVDRIAAASRGSNRSGDYRRGALPSQFRGRRIAPRGA